MLSSYNPPLLYSVYTRDGEVVKSYFCGIFDAHAQYSSNAFRSMSCALTSAFRRCFVSFNFVIKHPCTDYTIAQAKRQVWSILTTGEKKMATSTTTTSTT